MLCQCGCGSPAPLATVTSRAKGTIKGYPMRYISGHNSKGMKRGEGRYVNAHGYVLLYKPDHPRAHTMKGYVMEHRYLMEQQIGRYLRADEHVHHLNHDRSDNRLENLLIVDPVEHAQYHTSQPRIQQSEEHRRKTSEAMKRVWAKRKSQQPH